VVRTRHTDFDFDFDFDGTVEWLRDEGLAYDQAGGVGTIVMMGVTPSQMFEYRVIGDTIAEAHEIADQVSARCPAG
jgi:hypothetical protein